MRRRALAALVLSVVFGAAGPAVARADVCDHIPSIGIGPVNTHAPCKVVAHPVQTAKDVGHAVTHPVQTATNVATAPLRAAGDQVMQGVTTWVAKGAAWLIGGAGKLIDETTTPRIESPWFLRQYGTMGTLAAVFALPLLLVSVLQGALRRDGAVIARAVFVQLPAAFVLTAVAVTVVQLLLQLTDQMSVAVASSVGNDARAFFTDTGRALGKVMAATGGANPVPLFAVFLGALIAAAGAFFVWLELLIRSAAIYVAVLFLPFTFVAMIWPNTSRWCRRLLEMLLAIIFAKFVIVAIMALAAAGLGQSRSGDAFQGVLAGAALMLLAAFSPFVLLRLIPMAESAVAGAGGARSALTRSMLSPVASPGSVMRGVMDSNWSSRGSGSLRSAPASASAGSAGARTATTGAMGATAGATGAATAARSAGSGVKARAEGIEPHASLAVGGDGHAARPTGGPDGARPAGGRGESRELGDSRGSVAIEPPPRPQQPNAGRGAAPPSPPAPRPSDHEGGLGDG